MQKPHTLASATVLLALVALTACTAEERPAPRTEKPVAPAVQETGGEEEPSSSEPPASVVDLGLPDLQAPVGNNGRAYAKFVAMYEEMRATAQVADQANLPAEGPTTPEEGPVASEESPVTPEEGPTTPEEGPIASEEGLITPEEGPITPEEGPVTPEQGPTTEA